MERSRKSNIYVGISLNAPGRDRGLLAWKGPIQPPAGYEKVSLDPPAATEGLIKVAKFIPPKSVGNRPVWSWAASSAWLLVALLAITGAVIGGWIRFRKG